ncbi:MAG: DNA polymerase Y family protein [Deltaproteobacteria bacterium]|nr:DNA polymerase Y family protein [Deltaproteobacteria bacterium]
MRNLNEARRKEVLRPVLLAAKAANQIVVKRCCTRSRIAGVRPDMTLALAKALVPEAHVGLFDGTQDFNALKKLASKLLFFSPLVAIDTELWLAKRQSTLNEASPLSYGLLLDLTGTEKLHKMRLHSAQEDPSEELLEEIALKFSAASIEARLAVAPTIGAAWALSRFSRQKITSLSGSLSKSELSDALEHLPVQALRIPDEISLALAKIGITAIGQLLKLSKKSLGLRFGIQLVRRIDQALGSVSENAYYLKPQKKVIHRQEFDTPITKQEQLQSVTLKALQNVLGKLAERDEKPLTIYIRFDGFGVERQVIEREISLLSATREIKQLQSIISPIIEKVRFREGARSVTLLAPQTQMTRDKQVPFIQNGPGSSEEFSELEEKRNELLNNLTVRLGKKRLKKAVFNNSYLPERSFSYVPIDQSDKNGASVPLVFLKNQAPYLLETPEPIQAIAMLPDKPPSWIKWRDEKLFVVRGFGPSRISDEWWRSTLPRQDDARDYFRIQDQNGRWLWVFRNGTMQWFVHGLWI